MSGSAGAQRWAEREMGNTKKNTATLILKHYWMGKQLHGVRYCGNTTVYHYWMGKQLHIRRDYKIIHKLVTRHRIGSSHILRTFPHVENSCEIIPSHMVFIIFNFAQYI